MDLKFCSSSLLLILVASMSFISSLGVIQPVSAVYVLLLITGVDAGQGSVAPSCPSPTGCLWPVGGPVTITATPSAGWQFSSWSTQIGQSCSAALCTFIMPDNPVTLKATFISTPSSAPLNSVYMLSSSEGWAVGDPLILHYDGSAWNTVPAPNFPDFPSQPSAYNLTSVSFGPLNNPISKSDGWAVGYNGTVSGPACGGVAATCSVAVHWDGIGWRAQTAGLSTVNAGPLWSVSMVSPTDVWAVGQNSAGQGVFWHWTGVPGLGGGWNLPQPPVSGPVYSVFMVSAIEGWAVGSGGAIYHYAAGSWNIVQSPVASSLRAVFMISGTEGWAVGDGGVVVHYASGTWSGPVSPATTANNLVSVFMVSAGEGWAFGLQGTILHYSGGVWARLPSNLVPTSPTSALGFHAAYFNAARDGWVVGDVDVIMHYDGTVFGTVTSPTLNSFTSISFGPPLAAPINPNDGWAVGNASATAPFEPTIYHWNGFMWTKGVAIGTANNLNSVYMTNSGDVWAVGGGGNPTAPCSAPLCPVILHYAGGSWNTVTPPPGSYALKSVFMVSSIEGWAVGELTAVSPGIASGIILHWAVSGSVGSWGVFPAPSSPSPLPPLNSIFMLSQGEGWAVGDNATILHYTVSGGFGSWSRVIVSGSPTLSSDANLTSIFMLSPMNGWVVGGIQASGSFSSGPVILHWDGSKWEQVASPSVPGGVSPTGTTSGTLKSVFFTAPNDGWAVGLPGKLFPSIYHWDGFSWETVTLTPPPPVFSIGPIPPVLSSIYMTSARNGWIVGSTPSSTTGPVIMLSAVVRLQQSNLGGFSTSTVVTVSTVSSSTTSTVITTSTSILASAVRSTGTNTTVITLPSRESLVLVLIALIVVTALGLIAIMLILGRRTRRSPVVYYPVPRRPGYRCSANPRR